MEPKLAVVYQGDKKRTPRTGLLAGYGSRRRPTSGFPLIGRITADYRLTEKLAEGGHASVRSAFVSSRGAFHRLTTRDNLITTVFPEISACGNFAPRIESGQFQGTISAATPRGCTARNFSGARGSRRGFHMWTKYWERMRSCQPDAPQRSTSEVESFSGSAPPLRNPSGRPLPCSGCRNRSSGQANLTFQTRGGGPGRSPFSASVTAVDNLIFAAREQGWPS